MAFSPSLASKMYLSRTRLSQMRRGGAPRTGRPRGSSSKDSRSSRAGHSRKESQAECEAGHCRRRVGLDGQVHPSGRLAPSQPSRPQPCERAGSASFAFIQSRGRVHTPPPNYRNPLVPAKLQSRCDRGFPSRRSGLLLPGPGISFLVTHIAAPLSPGPVNLHPVPAQVSTCPGTPQAPPAGEGCPTPLALPGSLASLRSLNLAPSGPTAPAVNSSSNRGWAGGREYSPRAPISAPRPAPQRPGAWRVPAPGARILESLAGQGHLSALRRGLLSGTPEAGSEQSAQGPQPGSGGRRGEATGRGWPGDCGGGRGSGLLSAVCVRVGGWGEAVCVRGRGRCGPEGSEPGQDAWVGGPQGRETSGRGCGARGYPPNP